MMAAKAVPLFQERQIIKVRLKDRKNTWIREQSKIQDILQKIVHLK